MLYEVSVEKVWDRASKDQEGLENYFNAHKEKYKWEQPYAKGVLIQVITDSIGSLIKEEVNGMSPEEVAAFVKNRYSGKAIAEKFLVPKGVNAMVDNVMFGGKQAKPKNKMYKSFIIVDGRLLQSPEEMSDVRGAVTSDYQEQLEAEWVSELKRKYPVSLNKKEFNKLKKTLEKEK